MSVSSNLLRPRRKASTDARRIVGKSGRVVSAAILSRNVNAIYRLYGGKKYTVAARLEVLRSTIDIVGRILYIYDIDESIVDDYTKFVFPRYKEIRTETDVENVFDAMLIIVKRIRNKLS